MSKKQKGKLNTDLDESVKDLHPDDEIIDDHLPQIDDKEDSSEESEDDSIYTMGEIVVAENSEGDDDLRILQAGIKATKKEDAEEASSDTEEDYDWEVDLDASDPYLENDDYDPDDDAYE